MDVLRVQIEQAGYEPNQPIIRDISFSIPAGQLVGLIGPNGAGKSTTIKSILGTIDHVQGEIEISGKHRNYGYIPEKPILYDELTCWEHLELAAAAYELDQQTFSEKANALLKQFRLEHAKDRFPARFSKGMQQKMMLILSFLVDTELYIIDEPFMGLDPHATKDFLDLLNLQRQRGAGVLMSTHMLDTAEKICDSFLLLIDGKLIAKGTLEQIREYCGLPQGSLFDCFHKISAQTDEVKS